MKSSSVLFRSENSRGGGVSSLNASRRRIFAVALAAVAVALMLALGVVQPAHAEGAVAGTWGSCAWVVDKDTLTIAPGGGGCSTGSVENAPWNSQNADMTNVKKIVFAKGKPTEEHPEIQWKAARFLSDSAKGLFAGLNKIESIDLTYLDTSQVADMRGMFSGCSSLTTITFPAPNPAASEDYGSFSDYNLDTSHVTNMANMFSGCSKLVALDVSKFDTSLVTDMSGMFDGCASLGNVDVSKFDTSRVTNMASMFNGCAALDPLDVSAFDTSLVANMSNMFKGCTVLNNLDVSKFDTSRVTNMSSMFSGCKALGLLDVSTFETSLVADMSSMFSGCEALASLDVSGFYTSQVTNVADMFSGCAKLVTLDLSNFAASGRNMFSVSGRAALTAVRVGETFKFKDAGLPVNVENIGGLGFSSAMQWIGPQGISSEPGNELDETNQGAGWYLVLPQPPDAYAMFDWGVRATPPTFVEVTDNKVPDPGPMADGNKPEGWVDAAGKPVTSDTTIADGTASAFYAAWDKQSFSIDNYIVSSLDAITYDGKAHGVTVTPRDKSVGAVTKIRYVKSDGTDSTASPKDAGTYEVFINVAASAGYEGVSDFSLGSFTINKIKLDSAPDNKLRVLLPDIYEGTLKTTNTPIKITGGNVVPTEDPLNATAATVEYPSGNQLNGDHSDATVSGIQIENPNYERLTSITGQSYNVELKYDPKIEDFSVVLPGAKTGNKVTYNSQPQPAVIEPKDLNIGIGTVTVKYADEKGTPLSGAPKDVGTYQVSFDVAESATCYDASFKNVGTFTITPRKIDSEVEAVLPNVEIGTDSVSDAKIQLTVKIQITEDTTVEETIGATATVTYGSSAAAGTYEDGLVSDIVLDTPTNYTVDGEFKLIDQAYTVTLKTLKDSDFQNDMPTDAIYYNGQSRPVTVTANNKDIGDVTVFYAKDDKPLTGAPKDAGVYEVTFKVAESAVYEKGTFSLGTLVIKPIALDTTVVAVLPDVYEGVGTVTKTPITLTGAPILTGDSPLDATATVTHPSSDKVPTSYQDATVSAIELTNTNYTASNLVLEGQAYTVLAKDTPEPSDFNIGPLADIEYDGQEHPVSVKAYDPDNMGAATVKYSKNGGTATTVAPKDAGTYQVLIDVADGVSFWGAQNLDGGTFTIEKRVLNGQEKTSVLNTIRDAKSVQNVSVVLSGGAIVAGEQVPATASEVEFPSANVLESHDDAKVTLAPLPDEANYVLPGNSLTLTGQSYTVSEKPTPSVDRFVVTSVTAEYDGQEHKASVAPGTGVGVVENLRYLKGSTPVKGAPVDAGTYAVMFDVKEGTGYAAAKDLVAQGAVTITPRVLDGESVAQLAEVPQRTLEASNVAVTLSGGRILAGEVRATASKASYPSAATVGTYHDATVELALLVDAPNYALPADGLALTGQTYTVAAEPYRFLGGENGSWEQGSGEGLSVRVEADIDKYRATFVDDERVGDDNLTVTEGSTIVTLKPAYLATLAPGAHTLRIEFEDGVAETAFTVAKASDPGPGSDAAGNGSGTGGSVLAPTGDAAGPAALALAALAALAGVGLATTRRRG